eukprot:TRINITY_DN18800_c0_g1_i1.p1 TRINITY_DN18800_c0_g1~~TRINITY_DN18800_c0_g1_i1.p1  ORF type:complete len:232 (+),score=42.39 TRINITY_DN18800_c0_g1_i1:59-697(+)
MDCATDPASAVLALLQQLNQAVVSSLVVQRASTQLWEAPSGDDAACATQALHLRSIQDLSQRIHEWSLSKEATAGTPAILRHLADAIFLLNSMLSVTPQQLQDRASKLIIAELAPAMPTLVAVTFTCSALTHWGDTISVTGSTPQLGSWDPHCDNALWWPLLSWWSALLVGGDRQIGQVAANQVQVRHPQSGRHSAVGGGLEQDAEQAARFC